MPKAIAQSNAGKPDLPSRSGQGAETRARILAATADLVGERGWDRVTTRSIAQRAGVNQALVHYHFGSIEALVREAALTAVNEELASATAPLLEPVPLEEGIRGSGRAVDALDPTSPRMSLFIELLLRSARDPILYEALVEELRAFRTLLAGRIAAEAAAGTVRADVDPMGMAVLITAALDGLLLHRLSDRETDVTGAVEAIIATLRPAPPPGEPNRIEVPS
jgi:AcrR family transcriptional regulator